MYLCFIEVKQKAIKAEMLWQNHIYPLLSAAASV